MERGTAALGLTFASFMNLGPEAALTAARRADELGYRSFWTAETTGPEAFSLLAAAGDRRADAGRRRAMLLEARDLLVQTRAFLDEVRAGRLGSIAAEEAREIEDAYRRCEDALSRP